MRISIAGALLLLVLAACSLGARMPQDNFREIFGGKVGKSIDNPSLMAGGYPKKQIGSRTLPNGNVEVEYDMENPWGHCRILYEVDAKSRVIVGWHFEGSDQACAVPP